MIKGFTLLELLVVLLVLSLLAGVTAPRLTRMYDSVQMALERDEVLAQLGSLNYLAFQQSRDFELTTYPLENNVDELLVDEPLEEEIMEPFKEDSIDKPTKETIPKLPLELPEGWHIRTETPILFRANGACSGGLVYLNYQDQEFSVQLEPPFCHAKWLSDNENESL